MSAAIVQRLVAKDWYLLRKPILGYVAGAAIAVLMLATGGAAAVNAGSLLIITLLIAMGMHVVMATVVGERTEHTLPFVMSLPITIAQYTLAKIVANVSLFLSAWVLIAAGACAVVLFRTGFPHGAIVLSTITLLDILASYFVVLAVALITESLGWTIAAVVLGNVFLNVLMYSLSNVPSIKATYEASNVVWPQASIAVVGGELAVILLALIVTFAVQVRKTNFL